MQDNPFKRLDSEYCIELFVAKEVEAGESLLIKIGFGKQCGDDHANNPGDKGNR